MNNILSLVEKSAKTLKQEGTLPLIAKVALFVELQSKIYKSHSTGYEVSVDNVSASFEFTSTSELSIFENNLTEEREFISEVLDELQPNDVVWDVGANVGLHSCLFGVKSGTVISFEPYLPSFHRLQTNRSLNKVEGGVFPIALSDTDGSDTILIPEIERAGDQWPSLLPESIPEQRRDELRNQNTATIDTRQVDSLVENGVPSPDVLKIDVEGASNKVLKGSEQTLKDGKCRIVFIEAHLPNQGHSRPSIGDFEGELSHIRERLESYGFEVEILMEREADLFFKAQRREHS